MRAGLLLLCAAVVIAAASSVVAGTYFVKLMGLLNVSDENVMISVNSPWGVLVCSTLGIIYLTSLWLPGKNEHRWHDFHIYYSVE